MGIIYTIGVIAIIIFGIFTVVGNIISTAVIECDAKGINIWLKGVNMLEAIAILVLLIYFICDVA